MRLRMSVEVDVLLQEAKESIEAAQNYRGELQQRLHGLNQACKQVLQPALISCEKQLKKYCEQVPFLTRVLWNCFQLHLIILPAEVYNTNMWNPVSSMLTPRSNFYIQKLPDDC
uniref:Uncharacterized protein n=1 Tax=Amphilophus citrinellus TaxID=61819 RepID=A0A3Q0RXV4_AMPCI